MKPDMNQHLGPLARYEKLIQARNRKVDKGQRLIYSVDKKLKR